MPLGAAIDEGDKRLLDALELTEFELGTNIEKSTVSMVDLENKSSGAANSVKALSSDLDSTSEAIQKLGNNSDVAADDMQKVGDKAKQISSPIDELGDKSESTAQKLQSAGDKMKTVGTGLTAGITAPLALAGKSMIDAASDFDENLNKVNVAFGNSSEAVTAWADNATKQFGLSKNQALEATSLFGDMGTEMGLAQSDAADMSTSLAGLAGDLASFKNIDIEQAMTALSGVFTGETESLKQLGIVMTETNLEEFAAKTGKVYSEMGQAEKVQLRYNYVMEMTKNAQGDYARTSDGTANSLRTLQGSVDNLSIALGQNLLPIITPIINKMTEMVNKFSEMSPGAQQFILIMAGVAAAIGPVLIVVGQLVSTVGKISPLFSKAGGIVSGFSKVLGLLTGPVGLVAAAIAALVAVFAYLFTTNESFRESIMSTVQTLGEAFKSVLDALLPVLTNLAVTIGETFGKVLQTLAPILAQIIELVGALLAKLGEFIAWIAENIIPVLAPIIEFMGGTIIEAIGAIAKAIEAVVDTISALLQFVEDAFSGQLVTAFQNLSGNLWDIWTDLGEYFSNVFENMFETAKSIVTKIKNTAVSVFRNMRDTIGNVIESIANKIGDVFDSLIDIVRAPINGVIDMLNSLIDKVETAQNWIAEALSFSIDIPSGIANIVGFDSFSIGVPSWSLPRIPYLASGAVIPPNREFMAVLGDQTNGTNIEAPEGLLRKLYREEAMPQTKLLQEQVDLLRNIYNKDSNTYLNSRKVSNELKRTDKKMGYSFIT